MAVSVILKVLDANLTRHVPDMHGLPPSAGAIKRFDSKHRFNERYAGAKF
jgi:hypothetical protein